MTMWEEDNDRRMEVGGRYRRKVVGGSNLEDDNGRMEPREYNRENDNARVELGECNREDGRDCGGVSTPGHGQGEGPARYEFRESGTK